ncbi:MAG: hypothetical protein WKG06_24290 [Segetibacter sp.]
MTLRAFGLRGSSSMVNKKAVWYYKIEQQQSYKRLEACLDKQDYDNANLVPVKVQFSLFKS